MVSVELTPPECLLAANVGLMRRLQAITGRRLPSYGYDNADPWQADIEGACGECVVAKYLRVFWNGSIGDLDAADVGRVQVRTTRFDDGCLIVRLTDPSDSVFVLVVGQAPTYRIAGWIHATEAKRDEWFTDKGNGRVGAYFVPQGVLRPTSELHHASAF